MRTLTYATANLSTTSYDKAKAMGISDNIVFENVPDEDDRPVSTIRQAMLDQFGYVSKDLLDKVSL